MLSVSRLEALTEIEYSIPFIHIGSSRAFLFIYMGKQSENNEALNSEKQKRAFKLANAFMLTQNTCALVTYL